MSGANPPAATGAASTDPAANGVLDRRGKGGASVFAAHQVTDFEAFKKFFEDGAAEREQAGVKGHLLTHLDDGRVVIHLFADDLNALKLTLDSPRLQEYLKRPGGPDASAIWLAYDELIQLPAKPPEEKTFSLYYRLNVVDLPALRNGFVSNQALFREHGVVASSLQLGVDRSDLAFLHFMGTSRQKLEELTKRPEFLDWLGTRGTPEPPQSFIGEDVSRSRTYYSNFK